MGSPIDSRLAEIVESIPAGFLMCDAGKRIVMSNTLFRTWFFPGLEDRVVAGMHYEALLKLFLYHSPNASPELDADWIARQMARRDAAAAPFEHHLADGRVLRSSVKHMADGATIGLHTDITAMHRQKAAADRKSEQFHTILDSIDQGISMFDGDLQTVAYNERFFELLEFPTDLASENGSFEDFIRYNAERGEYGDGDIDMLVRERVDLAKTFEAHRFERIRPDGTVIEIVGTPVAGGGMVTTYTDVTERKKYEEALLRREEELTEQNGRFNAAIDNMSHGLCMFDSARRLLVCNRRFAEIYDLPDHLVTPGATYDDIARYRIDRGDFADIDSHAVIDEWVDQIAAQQPMMKIQPLAGDRTVAIVHQPMPNGGWVSTHEDTTELRRMQARLAHMSLHDGLTGLANRTLLCRRIDHAIETLKPGNSFAIMCLDLDRFKNVNESIGHPLGDRLLKEIAERLTGGTEEGSTVARLAGDEFAILLPASQHPEHATAVARRICDTLGDPFDLDDHQVVIGTTIGIAVAPQDGKSAEELMKNADMALYRAKKEGRGVYRFFEPEMDARMQARRSLEIDLRKAFKQGEFELHYQPLVSLETNSITGFEALLRWSHPEHGKVSPAEFIPIAEETGLIIPLGEWVVRQACRDAAGWPSQTKIAINLSPAQFRSSNLVNSVRTALAKSGIAPGRLELEITEHVLLEHNEATLRTLHALRDLGVGIAMDDFGTGYSSLSYLRSFPFDKIKIDRSFINDLSNNDETDVIVEAVASISQNLGMVATAEGVETESQRDRVKAAGYAEMQGFLISPARPADEILPRFFPEEVGTGASA